MPRPATHIPCEIARGSERLLGIDRLDCHQRGQRATDVVIVDKFRASYYGDAVPIHSNAVTLSEARME